MKRGTILAIVLSMLGVGGVWSAQAVTFNSSNFSINGNIGDSAAGQQTSTSYSLTSAAGESIAGNTSSKSYKLGQGYVSTLENSIQVVTQANGLVAYWPLDDVATGGVPMFDESQSLNKGTYTNTATSMTGKVGSALNANGVDYGTSPHSASYPNGSTMTVSAWIRPTSLTSQQAIATKWDFNVSGGTLGQWALQTTASNQIRAIISSGSGDTGSNFVDTTNANLSTNTWTHVVMVYDGSLAAANRIKVYINGVLTTTTTTGTIPASLYAASTNQVGVGEFPGQTRKFSGGLDEIKIYNRALTQAAAKTEFDAGTAGYSGGVALGSITPGVSQTSAFDSIVQTSAAGYTLAINQNNNLTSGGNTIPPVSGTIASPVSWSEGTTKGLGFTLYGTNATALPGTWSSGAAYAALPSSATSFYTRTGYTAGAKDVLNMRLRLDAQSSQPTGDYSNQMIITGTMVP